MKKAIIAIASSELPCYPSVSTAQNPYHLASKKSQNPTQFLGKWEFCLKGSCEWVCAESQAAAVSRGLRGGLPWGGWVWTMLQDTVVVLSPNNSFQHWLSEPPTHTITTHGTKHSILVGVVTWHCSSHCSISRQSSNSRCTYTKNKKVITHLLLFLKYIQSNTTAWHNANSWHNVKSVSFKTTWHNAKSVSFNKEMTS